MNTGKSIDVELREALDALRTASSQSNMKGKAVYDWFEDHFAKPAAISFITQGKQIGNRLKEQKGKFAPYTLFFFEDETLISKTASKAHDYYYEELIAIFYIFYDGSDYSLKSVCYQEKTDPAVLEIVRILGDSETIEDQFTVPLSNHPSARRVSSKVSAKIAEVGLNLLLYGAPGVGKSYAVNALVGDVNVERTVFHPDIQNSDFFGCLKPRSVSDGTGNTKVIYQFAPGPFSKALSSALKDPEHQHFLVIEELNRAPAASVFGELFQLLDREDDGSSTYKIAFPNPESEDWLQASTGLSIENLFIPSNLSIVATMNSSDQGVFPLDTAFRRRWEQEYLALYDGASPKGTLTFIGRDGRPREAEWIDFLMVLNNFLIERLKTPEDRLLGQWFLKSREMNGPVPSKILLYLWDDLLRHHGREAVFDVRSIRTFGEIHSALNKDRQVFSDLFLEELEAVTKTNDLSSVEVDEGSDRVTDSEIENDART